MRLIIEARLADEDSDTGNDVAPYSGLSAPKRPGIQASKGFGK